MSILYTETTLKSSVGEGIFVRQWRPEGDIRGAALLLHGIFEHSGRYEHIAERFVRHGYIAWAHDHYGHGKSAGQRGYIQSPDHFIYDVGVVVGALTKETGRKPILLGHSMGGAVAALYAVRHQETLRALILSSPALRTLAPKVQIAAARALNRVAPSLALPSGLPSVATHNPEWEEFKKNDTLKHERVTVRLGIFILEAGEEARQKAAQFKLPVLLLVSGDDQFVDMHGSQEFYDRLPPHLREMHIYQGYYHEVLNELEREKPLGDLDRWLGQLDANPAYS